MISNSGFTPEAGFLIAYGVIFIPLLLSIIASWPFYLRKFPEHFAQYETSFLFQVTMFRHRFIKFIYPIAVIFSVLTFVTIGFPIISLSIFVGVSVFILVCQFFSITHEIWIGLFSIGQYLNSRDPAGSYGFLLQRSVRVFYVVYFFVLIKDFGFFMWALYFIMVTEEPSKLDQVYFYYFISYIIFQMILFIGTVVAFSMKTESGDNFSEDLISRQTKIIGATKIVLFVLFLLSKVTGIFNGFIGSIFVNIDIVLVPLVIMLTEIMCSSNSTVTGNLTV